MNVAFKFIISNLPYFGWAQQRVLATFVLVYLKTFKITHNLKEGNSEFLKLQIKKKKKKEKAKKVS